MSEPPKDIRTGEPIIRPEVWAKMDPSSRALCLYHNSPHKQRLAEMYRRLAAAKDD